MPMTPGDLPPRSRRHRRPRSTQIKRQLGALTAALAFAATAVAAPPAQAIMAGGGAALPAGCVRDASLQSASERRCGLAAVGLLGATGVAASSDGRNVYVAAAGSDAVVAFARTPRRGTLHPVLQPWSRSCVQPPTRGSCAPRALGLGGADAVAISPDGRNVYVGSLDSAAVVAFARAAGGALEPLHGRGGCVQGRPLSSDAGPGCLEHAPLNAVGSVALSPDGRSVYALSYASGGLEDSLVALTRDGHSGRLTPVPAGRGGCVVPLGSRRCPLHAAGLRGASAVAVSPDGRFVYVASQLSSAVVAFVRNRSTGALRPVAGAGGCVEDAATPPPSSDIGCAVKSPALRGARALTLSPDGRFAYVASFDPGAVAVLVRDRNTGKLTPLPGSGGCLVPTGDVGPTDAGCGKIDGLRGAGAVALAPGGRFLYVATISGNSLLRVDRDPVGGALGASAPTHSIDGLNAPSGLAVPADGRNIYLVSPIDDTILSLAAAA